MGVEGISAWQLIIIVFYIVAIVLPFWKIFTKAGYTGWWSLLVLIPLVNVIVVYIFAFSSWPALKGKSVN
jgi:uncharacterized membrane protein YhaH (DUF805 family)